MHIPRYIIDDRDLSDKYEYVKSKEAGRRGGYVGYLALHIHRDRRKNTMSTPDGPRAIHSVSYTQRIFPSQATYGAGNGLCVVTPGLILPVQACP